jgi:hypothetical protein
MICRIANLFRVIRTIGKILGEKFLGRLPLGTAERKLKAITRFHLGQEVGYELLLSG